MLADKVLSRVHRQDAVQIPGRPLRVVRIYDKTPYDRCEVLSVDSCAGGSGGTVFISTSRLNGDGEIDVSGGFGGSCPP
eukprot:COSAG05_NODE_2354_length_3191_cov_2.052584_2_plen_79_part_00